MKRLRQLVSGRSLVIAAPFAFLLVFFLLPFLIVGRISVSEMDNVVFKDLITYQEGVLALSVKLSNYIDVYKRQARKRPTWRWADRCTRPCTTSSRASNSPGSRRGSTKMCIRDRHSTVVAAAYCRLER